MNEEEADIDDDRTVIGANENNEDEDVGENNDDGNDNEEEVIEEQKLVGYIEITYPNRSDTDEERYPLYGPDIINSIGKKSDCKIKIDKSDNVSDSHAQITYCDEIYVLMDLASKGGSNLGDTPLFLHPDKKSSIKKIKPFMPVPIKLNDSFCIADVICKLLPIPETSKDLDREEIIEEGSRTAGMKMSRRRGGLFKQSSKNLYSFSQSSESEKTGDLFQFSKNNQEESNYNNEEEENENDNNKNQNNGNDDNIIISNPRRRQLLSIEMDGTNHSRRADEETQGSSEFVSSAYDSMEPTQIVRSISASNTVEPTQIVSSSSSYMVEPTQMIDDSRHVPSQTQLYTGSVERNLIAPTQMINEISNNNHHYQSQDVLLVQDNSENEFVEESKNNEICPPTQVIDHSAIIAHDGSSESENEMIKNGNRKISRSKKEPIVGKNEVDNKVENFRISRSKNDARDSFNKTPSRKSSENGNRIEKEGNKNKESTKVKKERIPLPSTSAESKIPVYLASSTEKQEYIILPTGVEFAVDTQGKLKSINRNVHFLDSLQKKGGESALSSSPISSKWESRLPTHLVIPNDKVPRTLKFMQVMAMYGSDAPYVVTEDWISDSIKAGEIIDISKLSKSQRMKYTLSDLKEALERRKESKNGLFYGLNIASTTDSVPPPDEIEYIVVEGGGTFLIFDSSNKNEQFDYLIGSEKNKASKSKGINARIVNSKWLCDCLINYEVIGNELDDIEHHKRSRGSIDPTSKNITVSAAKKRSRSSMEKDHQEEEEEEKTSSTRSKRLSSLKGSGNDSKRELRSNTNKKEDDTNHNDGSNDGKKEKRRRRSDIQ